MMHGDNPVDFIMIPFVFSALILPIKMQFMPFSESKIIAVKFPSLNKPPIHMFKTFLFIIKEISVEYVLRTNNRPIFS